MKNETKKKVVAVAAGFTISTLFGTSALVKYNNPDYWVMAGVCIVAFGVALFTLCTID